MYEALCYAEGEEMSWRVGGGGVLGSNEGGGSISGWMEKNTGAESQEDPPHPTNQGLIFITSWVPKHLPSLILVEGFV